MNQMQRGRYIKFDVGILAELMGRDVETLAEHVGEMRLRAEAKIHSDTENRCFPAAQLINRARQTAFTDLLPQRNACRSFAKFLHGPERID